MFSSVYSSFPTRLQLASANQMARGLAFSDAQQKATELFTATDDFLRALKSMQACGASKDFLWDCAAGWHDQADCIEQKINAALDEQGIVALDPLDRSDLWAFIESVK